MSDLRINDEAKRFLLDVARRSIAEGLGETAQAQSTDDSREMRADCGIFVTLKRGGSLRGCIGRIIPTGDIKSMVKELAQAAAFQDPRFYPLESRELGDLEIEITLIGRLEPIRGPEDIQLGLHGLYIRAPGGSGLLLPQVAIEQGWSAQEFLGQVCRKAGLPPTAWKMPESSLFRFEGAAFS
ncbi:MAG TPA: AmmeMemoRadiSam system protein A [Rectinemataceae bacterium]